MEHGGERERERERERENVSIASDPEDDEMSFGRDGP